MNYEAALISKAVIEKAMKEIVELRLKDELFVSHKSEWEFISKFYRDHGDSPPPSQFEKLYPDFDLQLQDVPISFLVEELRKRRMHNLSTEAMKKGAGLLKAKDPEGAIEAFREAVLAAEMETRVSRDENLVERPISRLQRYDELVEVGGITGLPSPWDVLDQVTTGFNDEELIMIVARGGVGKCVDAESRIVDPATGIERTIREVVEGGQESVVSWHESDGIKVSSIAAKVDTGFKRCFTYKTESGREITVTPEHPFLTPEGWVRADLLDEGDYVALPVSIPEPAKPESRPLAETRFLALLLSEGSYTGNHVGFSSEDPVMVKIAEDYVRGTAASVVHRSGVDYDITVGQRGGHTPNPARELLRSLGIDNKLAKEKTVPDSVYRLPHAELAEFLAVFWMADGYVERGAPSITLASKRLIEQLQHLLLRFGIQSSVRFKPVKGGYEAWRLRVYAQSGPTFAESIPLWSYKAERLSQHIATRGKPNPNTGGPRWRTDREWGKPGVFWDRIKDVSDAGRRKIYDLTIDDTHCFVANDVIVHNTWAEVILSRFHWTLGHVPLVFTKEMSVEQIARRFDGVNAGLPYQRFRSGELTHEERNRFEKSLKDMEGRIPYWVSGDDEGTGGVSGIIAKIDRYKPRVAYLDGMYLVDDERGGESGWQRLSNVAWDLKQIARKKKIPFIVTHQFNKEAKEDKGTADNLAFGDVQKHCDLIIGMYQTEDLRLNKEMLFRVLKQREGERLEFVASWDLENMDFEVREGGEDDVGAPGNTFKEGDDVVAY